MATGSSGEPDDDAEPSRLIRPWFSALSRSDVGELVVDPGAGCARSAELGLAGQAALVALISCR